MKNFKRSTTWKKKDSENYVLFTLITRNTNFCNKHSKLKSCKLLFGCCRCFRAYCLITMEWHVKRIVPCKSRENFLSVTYLCVLTLFILNTLHCDAYWWDSVVKFWTQPQKLHTYATFWSHLCQKLAYC